MSAKASMSRVNLGRTCLAFAAVAAALAPLGEAPAAGQAVPSDASQPANRVAGPNASRGVTFEPFAAFELGEEIAGLDGITMRASILTIDSGGVIAVHDHLTRPAFSWILEGSPVETRSDREQPIKHSEGSISREFGMAHFWRNDGDTVARILVVDLITAEMEAGVAPVAADRKPERTGFSGPEKALGATVLIQGEIELKAAFPHLPDASGRVLRARRIDLQPGAVSHLHRHENAPSFTYIAAGTVREHRNDQQQTIQFETGSIAIDRRGMAHWWEVIGDKQVTFLVAEIVSKDPEE